MKANVGTTCCYAHPSCRCVIDRRAAGEFSPQALRLLSFYIAMSRSIRQYRRKPLLSLRTVREQVEGIPRPHDARAGQSQGHAGRVNSNPAPSPLLGHIRGRAGATSGIQYEFALSKMPLVCGVALEVTSPGMIAPMVRTLRPPGGSAWHGPVRSALPYR